MKAYHFTNSSGLKGILERGKLIPHVGRRGRKIASEIPAVFAFPSLNTIQDAQWLMDEFADEDSLFILEIEHPGFKNGSAGYEVFCTEAIDSDAIKSIYDEELTLVALDDAYRQALSQSTKKLGELGFEVDVPSLSWIQEQVNYAQRKEVDRFGVPYMGKITAYNNRGIELPVEILCSIKGERAEQSNVRKKDLEQIRDLMEQTGKLPSLEDGRPYLPFLRVAFDGSVWVSEGNHRIMAAKDLGWKSLMVDIRYFDGSETQPGILSVDNLYDIQARLEVETLQMPRASTASNSVTLVR